MSKYFDDREYNMDFKGTITKNVMDSHCHLDRILHLGQPRQLLSDFKERHKNDFGHSFEGCITVIGEPRDWSQIMYHDYLTESDVYYIIGCHPRYASLFNDKTNAMMMKIFRDLSKKPVAVGEIGLDYHYEKDEFENWRPKEETFKDQQKHVFKIQLKNAVDLKMPLCLHIREANNDAMSIMESLVPSDWKIHLHCFTDDFDTCSKWMQKFPNLKFGFVPHHFQPELVAQLPLEKILLETDALYFKPKKHKGKFSHPGLVIHTAAQIAEIKEEDITNILEVCRSNIAEVYSI